MKKWIAALASLALGLSLLSAGWAAAPDTATPGGTPPPSKSMPGKGMSKNAKGGKQGKTKAEKLGKRKININNARAKTLQYVPGIGEARAAKIIAERKKKPFASVDELVTRKIMSKSDLDKARANLDVK